MPVFFRCVYLQCVVLGEMCVGLGACVCLMCKFCVQIVCGVNCLLSVCLCLFSVAHCACVQ